MKRKELLTRAAAIGLSLVLCFGMTACGNKDEASGRERETEAEKDDAGEDAEEEDAEEESGDDDGKDADAADKTEDDDRTSEDERSGDDKNGEETDEARDEDGAEESGDTDDTAEQPFGRVNGNEYRNEFFGIGCKLDSSWTFATEEEIHANDNLTSDLADSSLIDNALESGQVFTDMIAAQNGDGTNVRVTVERLDSRYSDLTEQQYVDSSIGLLRQTMEHAGAEDLEIETMTAELLGEERYAVKMTCNYQGIHFYTLMTNIRKGDYIATIGAASVGEKDTTEEIVGSFYLLP